MTGFMGTGTRVWNTDPSKIRTDVFHLVEDQEGRKNENGGSWLFAGKCPWRKGQNTMFIIFI